MDENTRAWVIVTNVEFGRTESFGYSYRYDVINGEDRPSTGFLDKMEAFHIKRPKYAKYPFVVTFGSKPDVSIYQCKILRLNMSKPATLRHFVFLDADDWVKYMTGESDCDVFQIENPSDISKNLIGLTMEIAADEILECIDL